MKFKFCSILFFVSFLFYFQAFSSLEMQVATSFLVSKDDISIDSLLNKDNLTAEESKFKEDFLREETRFIQTRDNNVQFNKTVFGGANYFYLGANGVLGGAPGTGTFALVQVYLQIGQTAAQNSLKFSPLAPEKIILNEQTLDDGYATIDSPIYNSRVTNLTLMGNYPVITITNPNIILPTDVYLGPDKNVYLLNDIQTGKYVRTNEVEINDSNNAPNTPTNGVVGFATNGTAVFAAVRPNDANPAQGLFGQANSGFAVLIQDEKKLKPIDATTGDKDGNQAFNLNLNANQLLAITQNATVGGFGDMYWDATLQRLFIGLVDVRREDNANNGGAVSILVGRIGNNGALIIEPAVVLNANRFTADSEDFIFGFYNNNANLVRTSTYKMRTMHTSTGRSYLIVNGGVANADTKNEFYALPIIRESNVVGNIGKVADKNNLDQLPATAAAMSLNNEEPVVVGGVGNIPLIQNNQDVQDMFVVGDSVFVCVAETRAAASREAGIFRSTAIFDRDGKIRAWTPWQRVMGNVDTVFGAGLDTTLGNYWYLTGDNQNIVKVTQWGKSIESPGLMGNGLVDLLSEEFAQENAGVHQIFNFDEKTPSLARNNAANELSFMVATGFEKIALIETGKGNPLPAVLSFTPTQDEFQNNVNVFIKDDEALEDIGPICCAEVSRITADADRGWLFVGGDGGAAVLRDGDGDGWNGRRGAAAIVLRDVANFSFKRLIKNDGSSFSQVRKIICQGDTQYLYIMTSDKLYRVLMNPNKFDDAGTANLDEKEISLPQGYLLDMVLFYRIGTSIRLLVATTRGLFYSNDIDNVDENKNNVVWTAVTLPGAATIVDPVVHLNFISNVKGGFTINGNLYVLAADFALNLAKIYRFDVENGAINYINVNAGGPYDFYSVGELRTNFVTDGAFGYHFLSKHFGQTDFLKKINFGLDQSSMRRFENSIDLDLLDTAYNVGIMVQNSASGAWVVPGDWGIRVNE